MAAGGAARGRAPLPLLPLEWAFRVGLLLAAVIARAHPSDQLLVTMCNLRYFPGACRVLGPPCPHLPPLSSRSRGKRHVCVCVCVCV